MSWSNFSRYFISSIDAIPLMFRSGALRSWLTARRKSSFSAISLLSRLLAVSSCPVRWATLASRSWLADSSAWRWCLTVSHHLVERPRQRADHVAAIDVHLRVQVAGGDLVRRIDQLADGVEDPVDDRIRQRKAQQQNDAPDAAGDVIHAL